MSSQNPSRPGTISACNAAPKLMTRASKPASPCSTTRSMARPSGSVPNRSLVIRAAAMRSILERLDGATVAEQECIGAQPQRRQVDIARAISHKLDEAAIEAAIFRVRRLDQHLVADREPCAAMRQHELSLVGIDNDVPALRAGLEEIERGHDRQLVDIRQRDVGCDRSRTIRRERQIR